MNVKKLIGNKTVGAYLGLGVMLLAIVSFITYLTYATSKEGLMMPWVIVLLLAVIIGEGALFFFDNDYVPIAVAGCAMAAFGCFAAAPAETIGSIVDHLQNIVMFGNPEKFSVIVVNIVLMLVMSVLAVTACFFDRVKEKNI